MIRHAPVLALLVVFGFMFPANAAERPAPAAEIAPFINEQTVAVIRADLTGVNFDALDRWMDQTLTQAKLSPDDRKDISSALSLKTRSARQWIADFNRAGGKTIWAVVTLEDISHETPLFVVVPLADGAGVPALRKLFATSIGADKPGSVSVEAHGSLLIALDAAVLRRLQNIHAQPRPELEKALGAAGQGPLQMALIPSTDMCKVAESMAPPLPGGEPVTVLTRGILWSGAAIQLPPDFSFRLVVRSQDNASAVALQTFLKSMTQRLNNQDARGHDMSGGTTRPAPYPGWGDANPNIMPGLLKAATDLTDGMKIQGNRLIMELHQELATEVALDFRRVAQLGADNASHVKSARNIKELLLMCLMHANGHKGEFPDSLPQALKAGDGTPELLIDPRRPLEKVGYAYVKPPEGANAPADRLVIYERFNKFGPGVNVGFPDGHVDWVAGEAEFGKMLQEAERAQKVGTPDKAAAPKPK